MIELAYRLSDAWAAEWQDIDLAHADETTLRYRAFLGDVTFRANGADFSAPWGWIPLLDFSACLFTIVQEATNDNSESVFEFTESDAQIKFNRQGDWLRVWCNYSNDQAVVPFLEMLDTAKSFSRNMLYDLTNSYPDLLRNRSLKTWYPGIDAG